MVMMVTVALMMGEMGARWLSGSGYNLEIDISQSRGPGFETHPAAFACWASSFTTRCLKSEKDRSRSLNQMRKDHCNVNALPRWSLVNNSSSATIHHVALHSLDNSRQVAALI